MSVRSIEHLEEQLTRWQVTWASDRKRLRDEFAMAALEGLLACPTTEPEDDEMTRDEAPGFFASRAYQYADAMLEVREKSSQ